MKCDFANQISHIWCWFEMQNWFLQMHLSPDALAAHIGSESIFCVTHNVTHTTTASSPWINCLLCDFTSWLIGERGDESPFLMSSCRTAAYVVADMLIMSADKIPPDHSHVTVRTLRLPDMIRETNQICLQSEHSLKNSKLADNWN